VVETAVDTGQGFLYEKVSKQCRVFPASWGLYNKSGSIAALQGFLFKRVPTSRTPLKTEGFKQKRTSTLRRGLKKGQGFLLISCFQQAELPFLEGVPIGKLCDACKRGTGRGSKKKLLIDAILCPPISNLYACEM
jgi:hypothetical protein